MNERIESMTSLTARVSAVQDTASMALAMVTRRKELVALLPRHHARRIAEFQGGAAPRPDGHPDAMASNCLNAAMTIALALACEGLSQQDRIALIAFEDAERALAAHFRRKADDARRPVERLMRPKATPKRRKEAA